MKHKITTARLPLAVTLTLLLLVAAPMARGANACNRKAVELLKTHSPSGFNSYTITRDKNIFNSFSSDCGDWDLFVDSEINTAVHETVHVIRGEQNKYHLVSNALLSVPTAPNYFAPKLLVVGLSKNPRIKRDVYFQTYLANAGEGANSSRDDFTYLLDEMNAYANGMQTQIDFASFHPIRNRDGGLPAMMVFVASYASYAKERAPGVWKDLTASPGSETRVAVTKLWSQAERVLRRACELAPRSEADDSTYLAVLCTPSQTAAISAVIGRDAWCPKECSTAGE